ncbi:MAG: GntR family transcriptional regulator [Lachnospiraceae bacterium]
MYGKKHSGPSEAVYQKLKEQILHLELPPGTAISEIETAAQYDVSRTPIRDVFKALEAEGLLEIRPHIGTFVSLIDLNMISDILYTREVLEQAILKDLARKYDKSQEFRVHLILRRQKELIESERSAEELSRTFIVTDNDFHYTLYDMAGKKNVAGFFSSISSQYERFRTLINLGGREYLKTLYDNHVEMFRCITEQKYEELAERISHHIYDGFNASASVVYQHPEYFQGIGNKHA